MTKKTKDWTPSKEAKVLLIGHDPRLQESETIAEYALFADYYFKEEQRAVSEKKKQKFARNSINNILELTKNKFSAENIYVTNLCNDELQRDESTTKKTVYIPLDKAKKGIEHIKDILAKNPSIEYVFAMSQQVNYWLQVLGLYPQQTEFIERSMPKEKGVNNNPPYYESKKDRGFLEICGKAYKINGSKQTIIPILHTKSYSLIIGRYPEYKKCYDNLKKLFK